MVAATHRGETTVWFPSLVGDDGGQRWSATWSRAVSEREVEWRVRAR
jgi:hypothetical protein